MAFEKEQPIEPVLQKLMKDIGYLLKGALKEATAGQPYEYGFCLLMFATGEHPEKADMRMNYISSANRADMLAAMKEFIARNEGRYEGFDFTKRKV